jgi:ABC-type sugar transport system substrate-binding protein
MFRHRTASSALAAALVTGGLLLAPGAAARPATGVDRCAAIQHDLDAYRRGEVQYFVDPEPAWRAEAAELGCEICGL